MKFKRLNRKIAHTAVVAMTLVATMVVTVPPANAQFVSVNRISIMSNFALSHRAIGIAGMNPRHGSAGQWGIETMLLTGWWNIRDHAPNGHTIQEQDRYGRCLDSNHAGELYGIPCNGGDYQKWHFNYLGRQRASYYGRDFNVYQIVNKATGRCLDANLDRGYTLGCNGGNYQRWFGDGLE